MTDKPAETGSPVHADQAVAGILRSSCASLAAVNDAELESLVERGEVIALEAGGLLIGRDQRVEHIHLVLDGELAALIERDWGEQRIVNTIGPGGIVGEIELLNGDTAIADVRALRDSRLLRVPSSAFEAVIAGHPDAWHAVSDLARERTGRLLMIRHISRLFGAGPVAATDPLVRLKAEENWLDFEADILRQLEERVEWTDLPRGHSLFAEGDPSDGAYVLASGLLSVRVRGDRDPWREIARIHQGEIVGELGLIMEAPRSATITAIRDCELFRIPPDVFAEVTQRYPARMINVYRAITERFYRHVASDRKAPESFNVALLAAAEGIALDRFTRRLAAAIDPYRPFEHLTSKRLDEMLGHPGVAVSREGEFQHARLVQALNTVEAESDLIVYQGDQPWTDWNRRCIRQADEVLVLADATAEPDLSAIPEGKADAAQKWRIVLLHPAGTRQPVNTAAWLRDGRFDSVYHVREDHTADHARLARIVAGHATGLVLGGGGARGFAHLGVLRALEEFGIPVDLVGGTSIGAPIGGWVAQGRDAAESLRSARAAFRRLIDVTLPHTSIISGRRITRVIEEETADWDIEDYWLPYFCVSTNLTTFDAHVHRRGNSARAIRASVSIPGVLPPVPEGSELLVDGGVLNNLPIDVMRAMNPRGTVIAIDVVAPQGISARGDYGLSVSGWRHLLAGLLPGRSSPPPPPIASIIMQSMMVGSSRTRERLLRGDLADFYQNIHVRDVGLLQFDAVEQAAAIGYEQIREPLERWLATREDRRPEN